MDKLTLKCCVHVVVTTIHVFMSIEKKLDDGYRVIVNLLEYILIVRISEN